MRKIELLVGIGLLSSIAWGQEITVPIGPFVTVPGSETNLGTIVFLTGLTVSPSPGLLTKANETIQLQVVGQYSNGTVASLTSDPYTTYVSSGDTGAISVSPTGLVTAQRTGLASVIVSNARVGGVSRSR